MKHDLETTIEHAQKITLGQVDNGTLATAVTCAETLQIVRHGRVESYVIPKHLIDALLIENETLKWVEEKNKAIMEGDNEELEKLREENKRLLGERVAESITVPKSHFFNHDFKIDMNAVASCDMPHVSESMQEMEIRRRLRKLEQEPKIDMSIWRKNWLDQYVCLRPEQTPTNN